MTRNLKIIAVVALAMTFAPMARIPMLTDTLGSGYAYAAGKSGEDHGNSGGDHGNSGEDHGNAGGNHNGANANSDDTPWNRADTHNNRAPKADTAREPKAAAAAGAANAAHASVQGLLHASPNSTVGRLKTYADLTYSIKTEFGSALDEAQSAFDEAYPDFDALTDDEQAEALDSPEGVALEEARQGLAEAQTEADAAFALVAKNPESETARKYVDGLLSDYFDYLAGQ